MCLGNLPLRLLVAFVVSFSWCVATNAGAPVVGGQPEDDSVSKETRAFIDRLDAKSGTAREADLAGKGDVAALAHLRSAAEDGDAESQYHLALLYEDGKGVIRDDAQCALWIRKAADQDHQGAQVRLIWLYEKGKCVPRDLALAAGWARRVAENGESAGQAALATDYYYGRGVQQDYVQAVKWYTVLKAGGHVSEGDTFLERIKQNATALQIAQGESLAHDWLQAHGPKK